ncbi:MAG: 50S ribosomal protein L25, partial [Candidatus Peregrinibacteria bacterium]|nr:50S ribosomal protein L25 [Candidatus Peregrinibacteria bacterium]
MDTLALEAQSRDMNVRSSSLRRLKRIPAVIYGPSQEPVMISMDYQTFRRAYIAAGDTSIIDVDVDGGKKKFKVLVQDVQFHPINDTIAHVDFLNLRMDHKISTSIPVEVTGVAPAVKDLVGILTLVTPSVRVRCLPGDLVKSIVIDISVLKTFHDAIHVSDLKLPSTVQVLDDLDQTVANVLPPRKEEVVAVAAVA